MGCGESAPKDRLVRYVLQAGELRADPDRRLPGRGAYLHPDPACASLAVRRGGFDRSFRAPVGAPDLESLR